MTTITSWSPSHAYFAPPVLREDRQHVGWNTSNINIDLFVAAMIAAGWTDVANLFLDFSDSDDAILQAENLVRLMTAACDIA